MDMEFNDLQTVAAFVSDVGEDKYAMAKTKWLCRNYIRASAKLLIWMFNHILALEQRVAALEPASESVEGDDSN